MFSTKKDGNSRLQTSGTSLVILFSVYTEHPSYSFVHIVIFYHAGGVQFYCFQRLTFFLKIGCRFAYLDTFYFFFF